MAVSSFPLGMVASKCWPSELGCGVVCGLLLWHKSAWVLDVRLLELFSESKFLDLVQSFGSWNLVSRPVISPCYCSYCLWPLLDL